MKPSEDTKPMGWNQRMYDEAVQRATTEQGLDPVLSYFENTPGLEAHPYQSGGFTMIAAIWARSGERSLDRWVGVTANEEPNGYLVVGYIDNDSLFSPNETETVLAEQAPLDAIEALAREWLGVES